LKDFRWWANVYNNATDKISVTENAINGTIIVENNTSIPDKIDVYENIFVKNSQTLEPTSGEEDNIENDLINVCEGRTLKQRTLYSDTKIKRLQEYDKALSIATNISDLSKDNNNLEKKKKKKKHKRKSDNSDNEKQKKKRKLKDKHKKKTKNN